MYKSKCRRRLEHNLEKPTEPVVPAFPPREDGPAEDTEDARAEMKKEGPSQPGFFEDAISLRRTTKKSINGHVLECVSVFV